MERGRGKGRREVGERGKEKRKREKGEREWG